MALLTSSTRRPILAILIGLTALASTFVVDVQPSAAARPERVSPFERLGTHPFASAQPTAVGRALVDLETIDGRIYAGYGDYDQNTGPIHLTPYNEATSSFTDEFVADTEAAYNLRTLDGQLIVPSTDPRIAADFASSGPWASFKSVHATHVFDAATLTGTDLWLVGSQGYDAVAWRSTDGGATFTEMLREAPVTSGAGQRFHFAAVLGGRLYVQAYESPGQGAEASSHIFDGSAWSAGPSLLGRTGWGWQPQPFAGEAVYRTLGHGYSSDILAFDGQRASRIAQGYDMAVQGNTLYVLTDRGTVKATSDLKKWSTIATAPAGARSIAVDEGGIYIGTADSTLWRMPLR